MTYHVLTLKRVPSPTSLRHRLNSRNNSLKIRPNWPGESRCVLLKIDFFITLHPWPSRPLATDNNFCLFLRCTGSEIPLHPQWQDTASQETRDVSIRLRSVNDLWAFYLSHTMRWNHAWFGDWWRFPTFTYRAGSYTPFNAYVTQ